MIEKLKDGSGNKHDLNKNIYVNEGEWAIYMLSSNLCMFVSICMHDHNSRTPGLSCRFARQSRVPKLVTKI